MNVCRKRTRKHQSCNHRSVIGLSNLLSDSNASMSMSASASTMTDPLPLPVKLLALYLPAHPCSSGTTSIRCHAECLAQMQAGEQREGNDSIDMPLLECICVRHLEGDAAAAVLPDLVARHHRVGPVAHEQAVQLVAEYSAVPDAAAACTQRELHQHCFVSRHFTEWLNLSGACEYSLLSVFSTESCFCQARQAITCRAAELAEDGDAMALAVVHSAARQQRAAALDADAAAGGATHVAVIQQQIAALSSSSKC